jgi:hypothetical protein
VRSVKSECSAPVVLIGILLNMDHIQSISARILLLHRALDEEITQLAANPYQNQLLLQRLKKEKLRIKDDIVRLKDDLIPDLDA